MLQDAASRPGDEDVSLAASTWRWRSGLVLRDVPHDTRAERCGDALWQVLPYLRRPRQRPIIRRGRAESASRACRLIPPEWLLARTPLQLELMRAAAGRAAAKVEQPEVLVRGAL